MIRLLILLSLFSLALSSPARAAIRHDSDQFEGGVEVSQLFFAASVSPGADRFFLLAVTTSEPIQRLTSASYGGADFAFLGEVSSPGGRCRQEWWGLVAPAEGTNAFRLALGAVARHVGVTLVSYSGVDQRQPTGPVVTSSGPLGPARVTVASAPGQLVLDGVCGWGANSRLLDAGPGQTARWHWSTGALSSAGSQKAGAASVSLSWTANGDGAMEWAAGGLAVRPALTDAEGPPPVKLAVETAGCAVGRSARTDNAGSRAAGVPILLASLLGLLARATRRRKPG